MNASPRRRRIWSETVSFAALADGDVFETLAAHEVSPLLAVRPGEERAAAEAVRRARACNLPVGLWPMLADEEGRWCSASTARAFTAFVDRIATACGTTHPHEIVFDMEPPFAEVARMVHVWHHAPRVVAANLVRPRAFDEARADLSACIERLAAVGVRASAAIVPFALATPIERALGTPIRDLAFAHVSAMLYTSLLEGYSRGLVSRSRARDLLAFGARAMVLRFGARAGVSLGAVGIGALGDEPIYRSPDELADDVAIATKAGIESITLLDLGGAIARAPLTRWLEALG